MPRWRWGRTPAFGAGVDRVGFVLFVGAAMSITAFPVLAWLLQETGLIRTRTGVLAMTCAAIDDVTAWCLLAVVVAATRCGDAPAGAVAARGPSPPRPSRASSAARRWPPARSARRGPPR